VVATAGPALAAWLAPADLLADRALPLSFWGSLAGLAALVGPPTVLLGMVPPLLVARESAPGHRGRAAGRVFAAGTVGSLVGTFVAPLLLLGTIASRATVLVAAALLAAPVVLRPPRAGRARWLVAAGAVLAAALAGVAWLDPTLRRDAGQVVEVETAYQTVRVAELDLEQPVRARTRFLRFDEDVEAYQSVLLLDAPGVALTGERYYDHLALGAWFHGMPWTERPASAPRVLVVGYAGGTLHRVLDAVAPEGLAPTVMGVEIDPDVTRLARAHLRLSELETPRLTLLSDEDGRAVVESLPEGARFDLIFVDAYQRTQYVPFHLATVEFFAACARRLAPGGAVGMNVMSEQGVSGGLVRSIAATLREGLRVSERQPGEAFLVPNPSYPGNVAVWGTRGRVPRVSGAAPRTLASVAFALDALLVRQAPGDPGIVLTDDRAPTESLADAALLGPVAEGDRP
jgi:spermidine synthase